MRFLPISFFILTLIFLLVGNFLVFPERFGYCPDIFNAGWEGLDRVDGTPSPLEGSCNWNLSGSIGNPLKILSQYFLPIAILLFFVNQRTLRKFWKFILWFLPLTALIIYLQPVSKDALDLFTLAKTPASIWFGTIFLIVSACIIFFGNLPNKKKE